MISVGSICPMWAGEVPSFAGGTGEPNDPFQIATAEQLTSIGSDPNLLSKHFELVSDIDLNPCLKGRRTFNGALIAYYDPNNDSRFERNLFSGSFDGKGHAIWNLTIDTGTEATIVSEMECLQKYYIGLFGKVSSEASIISLRVLDANIVGDITCSWNVGIIAGANEGTIESCSTSGTVIGQALVGGVAGMNGGELVRCVFMGSVSGVSQVGGIVGLNTGGFNASGSLSYCSSTSVVTGKSISVDDVEFESESTGGIVGRNEGPLSHCRSYSSVTGNWKVGGVVGSTGGAALTDCAHSGSVTGGSSVGGFAGFVNSSTVSRCKSTGTVKGGSNIGGFAGYNDGRIIACCSDSGVMGRWNVGGFIGKSGEEVENCYCTGIVDGYDEAGGFIGRIESHDQKARYCYSTCLVHGPCPLAEPCDWDGQYDGRSGPTLPDRRGFIGGFVGYNRGGGQVKSSFWDKETSKLVMSDGGKGLSTVEMQSITTYLEAGWDFGGEGANGSEDLWMMPQDGATYPRLAWE